MTDVPSRAVGSEHDFGALFRGHSGAVFRAVYAYSGGRRALAEEATAEAFARAIASERRIRDPIPWIYRTAFRAAAAELRKERREPIDPPVAEEAVGLGQVVDALRSLTPNQRAAIVLRYEADLPVREIAARMGTSAATVRVHLHRGRNRLRDLLGTEEIDDA